MGRAPARSGVAAVGTRSCAIRAGTSKEDGKGETSADREREMAVETCNAGSRRSASPPRLEAYATLIRSRLRRLGPQPFKLALVGTRSQSGATLAQMD